MLVYSLAALLVSAWAIYLLIAGEKEENKTKVNLFDKYTSVAGAALCLVSAAVIVVKLITLRNDPEAFDFIKEASVTYLLTVGAVFLLLFLVAIIATLSASANRKMKTVMMHRLRALMFALSTVFIMTINYIAFIADSHVFSLHVFLLTFGCGLALMMRIPAVIESRVIDNGERK